MRRSCLVLALPCLAAACTESTRPVASSARHPEVVDAAATTPAASGADATWDGGLPPFASWTDPEATLALLRGAELPSGGKDPRSCNFEVPQQSCIPGPDAVDWGCRSDCATDCSHSASECLSKLTSCRTTCGAGAVPCERSCAQEAGKCVQACLTTRDRCGAECVKRVAEYLEEVRTNYGCKDKRPALEICKRTVACVTACNEARTPEKTREACGAACKKSRAGGCNEHFMQNVELSSCFAYESPI